MYKNHKQYSKEERDLIIIGYAELFLQCKEIQNNTFCQRGIKRATACYVPIKKL